MNKSLADAIEHIAKVDGYMDLISELISARGLSHDASKLEEPELSGYAGLSEAVKGLQYGTDEYRAAFAPFKEVIQHHYAVNDHHPEHFKLGVGAMNLLQIIEMVADWKAASMRNSASLKPSLDARFKRFGIDDQLAGIIRQTVDALDW